MNWLYLTIMGYIVTSALWGFHRGFLRVVYSIVSLVIAIVFLSFAAPLLRNVILESTTLSQQIEAGSEKYIRKQMNEKLEDGSWTEIVGFSSLALPKELKKELNQAAQSSVPDILESNGIYKKMAQAAADLCVTGIAFAISLVIIWVILFLIGKKLDWFSRKPGIHLVNMVFGFFAGVVKAFLVIWVVFLFIQMTQILPSSAALIRLIEDNAVLRGLYEKNLVLELMQEMKVFRIVT